MKKVFLVTMFVFSFIFVVSIAAPRPALANVGITELSNLPLVGAFFGLLEIPATVQKNEENNSGGVVEGALEIPGDAVRGAANYLSRLFWANTTGWVGQPSMRPFGENGTLASVPILPDVVGWGLVGWGAGAAIGYSATPMWPNIVGGAVAGATVGALRGAVPLRRNPWPSIK